MKSRFPSFPVNGEEGESILGVKAREAGDGF